MLGMYRFRDASTNDSGAILVWSEKDPKTEDGVQDWVAAAKRHSMILQEIRGTGPLVSGLMGDGHVCWVLSNGHL